MMLKQCYICKELKEATTEFFYKCKTAKDGLVNKCKLCNIKVNKNYANKHKAGKRNYDKIYWKINNERLRKLKKDYYKNNKVKILNMVNQYFRLNKDKMQDYRNKYHRERRKLDKSFTIACSLRSRLTNALRRYRIDKKVSSVKNLGCSLEELCKYLESKWMPEMSWENYGTGKGKWNIGHIKALTNFDLTNEKEQLEAVHYTNLKPMWSVENTRKSNN